MKNEFNSKLYKELEKKTVTLWSIPTTSVPCVVEALKKEVIAALENDNMELVDALFYSIKDAMREYNTRVDNVEAEMKNDTVVED